MDIFDRFYKCICCERGPKFPTPYNFQFNSVSEPPNADEFETNYIRTAKYRWYDFLISMIWFIKEALLLQYTRIANVYFLFIGILSSIPAISPVSSATIWGPIAIVLLISIAR